MNAARLWWLLRYLGHEEVFILEGGFSQWKAKKYPVADHQPVRVPSTFVANVQPQMLAGVEEVQAVSEKTVSAGTHGGIDVTVSDAAPTLPVLIDSRPMTAITARMRPWTRSEGISLVRSTTSGKTRKIRTVASRVRSSLKNILPDWTKTVRSSSTAAPA